MYKRYNANPIARRTDDCTVRAISKVLNKSWDRVYCSLCQYGRYFYDMPSANHVWGQYLLDHNYKRFGVPTSCPLCYTVSQFAKEHPQGRYILALPSHVVADIDVIDKLVHSIEKIDKIMMAEGGSSYAGYRNSYGPMPEYSNRNGMWSAEGSYANDDSYGRSGTHFVNSHYSRDGEMIPDRRMY